MSTDKQFNDLTPLTDIPASGAEVYVRDENEPLGDAQNKRMDLSVIKDEIDTKAPASHTHTKSDITDFNDADYATASHGHSISEVTGLQSELDSKAASSHTHTLSDITDLSSIRQVPAGGATDQVLTKTASGYEWANASGGGGIQKGTTAERPASPAEGYLYVDTQTDELLIWGGLSWEVIHSYGFDPIFGTPHTVWSVRKIVSNYTGNAIRVRRSSDNAEQDIGFNLNNELDTTALTNFAGAGDAFVVTWYDQSGNNNHATQNTAASQPKIVNAGSLITENGKPALDFDGVNDALSVPSSTGLYNYLHDGTSSFMTIVSRIANTTNPNVLYGFMGTAISVGHVGFSLLFDDRSSLSRNNNVTATIYNNNLVYNCIDSNVISFNQQMLLSFEIDADNASTNSKFIGYRNGASMNLSGTSSASATSSNASYNLNIGQRPDGLFPLRGVIQEIIMYGDTQSLNRTTIESNINTYYGIY